MPPLTPAIGNAIHEAAGIRIGKLPPPDVILKGPGRPGRGPDDGKKEGSQAMKEPYHRDLPKGSPSAAGLAARQPDAFSKEDREAPGPTSFYIKGDFIHARDKDTLESHAGAYLKVMDGRAAGFFDRPEGGLPVMDHSGHLIIPSFVDLHVHAAQYPNLGLGMDMPLLPWLNTYTFPLEARFKDPAYARLVYPRFIHGLWRQGSLRSCIFASLHRESTEILMDFLLEAGLSAYVGKVNMNRNSPETLIETTEESLTATRQWLEKHSDRDSRVRPILTPRFVPSVSSELMDGLAALAREFGVPVQSHLNENLDEIQWVRQLHPESASYFDVYRDHDLVRDNATIMAHSIYNSPEEDLVIAESGVFMVHCPTSNLNMASGMMPAAAYLRSGKVNVALGTDIAGGHTLSIPHCIVSAMQISNMLFLLGRSDRPLTLSEAFWMGTRGGGKFFGEAGSFQPGAPCDLLVIDDSPVLQLQELTLPDRLSRFLFSGEPSEIRIRMLEGEILPEPAWS